jgi:SAM-dependent methyltransferase
MTAGDAPDESRSVTTCRVCSRRSAMERIVVREMMFGSGEPFEYEGCSGCGSIQIRTVPPDLARHYPPNYYSFGAAPLPLAGRLRRRLWSEWARWITGAPDWALKALQMVPGFGPRMQVHELRPLRGVLERHQRIADVGGGAGLMLKTLSQIGFAELTCVDPFIDRSFDRDGIRFVKATLGEVPESFDLIMYHHALEHVVDLDQELRGIARRLAPGGRVLIRSPLVPNVAYERYGADWVQLDAPRHIHVFSRIGLAAAAGRAGLRVVSSGDDSTMFQFWASELYKKGIPLAEGSPRFKKLFSSVQLREFRRAAVEANAAGRGDQGWFLLAHAEGA